MSTPSSERTRYALVGTGSRAQMYLSALAETYTDIAELVCWADTNPGRLRWSAHHFTERSVAVPATFAVDALAATIREHRIDTVIITTPDHTHARYIVEALDAGADVVVEKPLTVNEDGVAAIADAVARTGRSVTVTFNYRYAPRNAALKQVIANGEIGEVTSVHFEWVLDTSHGADYFRRWHREKAHSGGLLVHKSSHHFDLVNWWTSARPRRVFASGGLRFYGAENARARGVGQRPERGSIDSPHRDAFSLDLRHDPQLKALYFDQEDHDGYLRDRDVFDEGITIEDNLSLVVEYDRGHSLTYALNAHSPWEGYVVAVNGTAGRAELTVVERGSVITDENGRVVVDPSARPDLIATDDARPVAETLVVQKHFETAQRREIPSGDGGHGGGDSRLLDDIFRGVGDDPLGFVSTWRDGVDAMVVGLAGNRSLESGQVVSIDELALGTAHPLVTGAAS